MKVCNKCNTEKPLTSEYWHKAKKNNDGFATQCKLCRNEYNAKKQREKYQDSDGKNKIKESSKKYYENNKEKIFEKQKEWNKNNPDKLRQYEANFRNKNRHWFNEYHYNYNKEYKKDYINKMRLNISHYKSKAKFVYGEIESNYTVDEWMNAIDHFNYSCAYCGLKHDNLMMEHVTPLSRGGNFTKHNIVPTCRSCNSTKGKMNLEEFKKYSNLSEENYLKIKDYLAIKKASRKLLLSRMP